MSGKGIYTLKGFKNVKKAKKKEALLRGRNHWTRQINRIESKIELLKFEKKEIIKHIKYLEKEALKK